MIRHRLGHIRQGEQRTYRPFFRAIAQVKDLFQRQRSFNRLLTIVKLRSALFGILGIHYPPNRDYRDTWAASFQSGLAQPLIAEVAGDAAANLIFFRFADRV